MNTYCFIVTSCIYPCQNPLSYVNVRSVYTPTERLEQTRQTITSIKRHCPKAIIYLLDNGLEDVWGNETPNEQIKYTYLGGNSLIRRAADSKFKSLGETMMLLHASKLLLKEQEKFDLVFKISERYWINENFDVNNFRRDAFTFLHLQNRSEEILGYHSYVYGQHSTRLFAFPGRAVNEFRYSLLRTMPWFLRGRSLEAAWAKRIRYQLYYIRKLGVSGYVGPYGEKMDE